MDKILKSGRLDLRNGIVTASFMVVDGTAVCYETTNYTNPEEFTLAISHYDDPYLANRFISFYNTLVKNTTPPKLLASSIRRR